MKRPNKEEYHPKFQRYIDLVKDGDFYVLFSQNTKGTIEFFSSIPEKKSNYKYRDDKWTIKQLLMHIMDVERMFSFRTLVCLRGDNKTVLQGWDDNLYASNVDVMPKTLENLIEEFKIIRANTSILFNNITDEQSMFLGNCNTYKMSARALGYIMIGHILHHIKIIEERYL